MTAISDMLKRAHDDMMARQLAEDEFSSAMYAEENEISPSEARNEIKSLMSLGKIVEVRTDAVYAGKRCSAYKFVG